MRIVQLLPELNEGGVERGTVELNREFVVLGHESVVISRGGTLAAQIEADGGRHITLDVCGKNPLNALSRMWRLRSVLRDVAPDLLHARSRVPAWLTWLANRPLRIPFVTTVHGFNSVSPYSRVMTFGDRVICVSNAIRDYIIAHYGTDRAKIRVVPRGVDLKHFNPERLDEGFIEAFREEHGLAGKLVLTSVGRITQLKDYETFIRAVGALKTQFPNAVGLIVGGVRDDKRAYAESLKALARSLDLEQAIRFTGSQSRIAEIYSLSDVIVSASKKPESFGRSVAEALALGTPVVATDHGGVRDIILEGINGAFFPIGDVEALADRIVRVLPYRFDGYAYIGEHFSLQKMLNSTLEIYKELVN